MKLRLLISISLLAFALPSARAQSADDFFHSGARSYLSNNVAGARQEVDKGLKQFPNDDKLKKLDALLKQQQQQQQQNQQQQNQQQQNQSQQNQQQQKQNQQQQSQAEKQKQDEEQKKQQEQQQKDQQPQQNPQRDQEQQGDKDKQKEDETPPGQMSLQEAKRLLDAQKNDESRLPSNHNEKHDREHPLKDW